MYSHLHGTLLLDQGWLAAYYESTTEVTSGLPKGVLILNILGGLKMGVRYHTGDIISHFQMNLLSPVFVTYLLTYLLFANKKLLIIWFICASPMALIYSN